MAKNNKGKVIQMLSPENYIRKKARTLPIYECLVNSEWEEGKMTTVLIARKHINGNITACSYLIDLMCLGVKDSMFLFNVPVPRYEEFKNEINGEMEMVEVDYTLAHNIVFAGVEFADDFGFKPHKDYESVTKFMLEEDTEDIDLIEIECGIDGQPVYMRGPFDDDVKARRIVTQLEKTAGPGNYTYIDNPDEWEEEEDEFGEMTFEEKRKLFLTQTKKINDQDEEESKSFIYLTNSLVDDLIDVDKHNQFYDEFMEELNIEVDNDGIPDQLLGILPGDQPISKEFKVQFIHLYQLINENPKLANEELKLFRKATNGIPGIYFLELLLLHQEESPKYAKMLKEYGLKYPDYPMIQLFWAIEQVTSQKNQKKIPGYPFTLKTFFPNRETIHPIERFYTMILYSFVLGIEMNINKIEAFNSVLYEFDLPENEETVLGTSILMFKVNYLLNHLMK